MMYVYFVKLRLNIERYRLKEEKSHLLYTEADISNLHGKRTFSIMVSLAIATKDYLLHLNLVVINTYIFLHNSLSVPGIQTHF